MEPRYSSLEARSNRPDGPSFKARWLALSSGSPSGRRDPGGAVQRGAVAHPRGALPGRGLGGGPGAAGASVGRLRGTRVRDGARLPVRGARRCRRRRRDADRPARRSTGHALLRSLGDPARRPAARRPRPQLARPRPARDRARGAHASPNASTSRRGPRARVGRPPLAPAARRRRPERRSRASCWTSSPASSSSTSRTSRSSRTTAGGRASSPRASGGQDNEQLIGQSVVSEPGGVRHQHRRSRGRRLRGLRRRELADREPAAERRSRGSRAAPSSRCRGRGDVIGVVFAAVRRPRLFDHDELALMQTLASEAGLALERTRSADALADALERERLIARISREVRSRRDLDELLRVAVQETAKAARVERCFIRLGEPGEPMPVVAEWAAPGVAAARGREPPARRATWRRASAARSRSATCSRRPSWTTRRSGTSSELIDRSVRAVAGDSDRRVRPGDRRARPAPRGAGELDAIRDLARRGGRAGGGDRRSTRAGCSARATAGSPSSRRC